MRQPLFKSYVICTSPRSGSTLLCNLLADTKLAGNPGSLFHNPSIEAWLKHYDLDAASFGSKQEALHSIFEAAKARGKGETDVFGLRIQRGSFAYFVEQLALLYPDGVRDVERIEAAFGPTLFIHLSRDDKLDQAISYIRAEQTGLWHRRADGSDLERQEVRREGGYDPVAIEAQLTEFAKFDAAWRSWFDAQAIEPLRVSYEMLARAPQTVLSGILDALGIDAGSAREIPVRTSKLADKTSRDWRRRFQTGSA